MVNHGTITAIKKKGKERKAIKKSERESDTEKEIRVPPHRTTEVKRSARLDTEITLITGERGIGKAQQGKERVTDVERKDKERGVSYTDPLAVAAVGGIIIVMTQIATGGTGTSAPDISERAGNPARSAVWIRITSQRSLNKSLTSW